MTLDSLYAGESIAHIILVTGILGGGAAWLSGRAMAGDWRPQWQVAIAAVLIGAATRFIAFALFEGELLAAPSFCCDTLIFLIVGLVGWRVDAGGADGAAISLALRPRRAARLA